MEYNSVYKFVAPKMQLSQEASKKYESAMGALKIVQDKVAKMERAMAAVNAKLQAAMDEKAEVKAKADACETKMGLANRLVGGLASEGVRWKENVLKLQDKGRTLVGDTLLSAAFTSYIGAFSMNFRIDLWKNMWIPDMLERGVPLKEGIHPMDLLADESSMSA